jgi:cell wall-active antibiotic response 4TMS protein YvqF
MMTIHPRQDPRWAGLVIGPLIVLLGIVLLLDQTGLLGWHPSWSIWPFLLIGLGLSRLAMDGRPGGGWLVAVGAWLLLDEMRILRVRDSWPLLLVAFGVHHIWKALRLPRTRRPQGQSS